MCVCARARVHMSVHVPAFIRTFHTNECFKAPPYRGLCLYCCVWHAMCNMYYLTRSTHARARACPLVFTFIAAMVGWQSFEAPWHATYDPQHVTCNAQPIPSCACCVTLLGMSPADLWHVGMSTCNMSRATLSDTDKRAACAPSVRARAARGGRHTARGI